MTSLDAGDRAEAVVRAVGELPDDEIDLAGTALALADLNERGRDPDAYRRYLNDLAGEAADMARAVGADHSLEGRLAVLRSVVFDRHGYRGDRETYDDLQNADLMRVIDRRRGLPVALGILCIHAARACGWEMDGLDFPGHFVLRASQGGCHVIVDPFSSLSELNAAQLRALVKEVAGRESELASDYFVPLGNRGILLRLQNNRRRRFLRSQKPEEAVKAVEAMAMMAPAEPWLRRDAGILHAHLGNVPEAIAALERFLSLAGDTAERGDIQSLLSRLRARIN